MVLTTRSITIQIISRYVPIADQAGHFTYILDLMRYFHRAGFFVELDVLDPWFLPENIPEEVHHLASVVIMPVLYVQMQHEAVSHGSTLRVLHPFYARLPAFISQPLRAAWYRFRKKSIPGHHEPDATATEAEIAFIRDRVARNDPDVLITNETFLGNILNVFQGKAGLLKMNIAFDLHHQRQKKFHESGASVSVLEWSPQKEIDLLKAADIIVAIHEDDATTLREMLPQTEVICVPMSAELHPHDVVEQAPGRCLFVGSDIEHNVHGLNWFLTQVWPHISSIVPQAALHVCGTVCSKIDNTFPNVQLLGRVEQLNAEYAAAEVCLIPLVVGSGLKIKLVEALSHGRACVATTVGVQGVQELRNKAVLVADTPEEFTNAMITILQDAEKRQVMELESRRYVTENLTSEKAYQPFIDRIERRIHRYKSSTVKKVE